ncbi:hypothetical protein [Candidatus Raskinella chloraquaticus]|uniref:Chemotaxis protein CheZ n=1 Tax=Candidatus Raskinella chloraquaticus TaxID=1951219 RepID=A0A1W9HS39_9HYPH|nr:MAG: hypothetical protein A4S15_01195 [Proteobacteria bacterium SG_bin8]
MSNDILSEQDYEAIEAAVMETERGRWFLREYAARNRVASTSEILDVLSRIESRLAAAPATRPEAQTPAPAALISAPPQPAVDISVISGLIAAARGEMAALREEAHHNGRTLREGRDFDAISAASDNAINSVLNAAERIQELSWILRERGMEAASCDELDQRASEIYLACSFQDMASRRLEALVETLVQIDTHVASSTGLIQSAPGNEAAHPVVSPTLADTTEWEIEAVALHAPRPQSSMAAAVDVMAAPSHPVTQMNVPSTTPPVASPVMNEPRPRRSSPHQAGNLALSHDDDVLEMTAPAMQSGINYDELSFSEKIALFS